jgi:hypothetical protein
MRELRDVEFRIHRLATYNSEVHRGLVHTEEWQQFMGREQAWFNDQRKQELVDAGGYETSPGVWLVPRPKRRWWAFR